MPLLFSFAEAERYDIYLVGQKDEHCSSNDNAHNNEPYRWPEVLCSTIVGIFVALCLLACYADNGFLRFFSIKNNLNKIYKISEGHTANPLGFIHGFKAIYVALSAMAHACGVLYVFCPSLYASARTYQHSGAVTSGMLKRILIGPEIAVFISGFLAFIAWSSAFNQKRTNLFIYTFARFLRTVPILIAILLLDRVWPRYGSGPFFRQMTGQLWANCDRSFWKLFLFISNQDRVVDLVSYQLS